jgi:hypothetical protein
MSDKQTPESLARKAAEAIGAFPFRPTDNDVAISILRETGLAALMGRIADLEADQKQLREAIALSVAVYMPDGGKASASRALTAALDESEKGDKP